MKEKTKKKIKDNLAAVKEMAIDLGIRSIDLLDAAVWTSPEVALFSVANLGRSFLKDRLEKMFGEVRKEREANKIDEEVLCSEKTTHAILGLTKFMVQQNPDSEVWNTAKKIFMRTLRKETTEQERTSLYSYLDLCQELSGAEIMILAGAYRIYKNVETNKYPTDLKSHHTRRRWAQEVAEFVGYKTEEEVLRYEESLAKQKLIYPSEFINGNERGDWTAPGYAHRLTALGVNFSKSLSSN
ncbi:MAG: hypothetical protein A2566_00690 [Candidatus Zambryskibacteria bacterium RIFOXYD1_FULL_40_13]|nr:MAG: hypothetical protein UT25_C0001G0122 [Parcubacteria group bacterium GW2011_GWC1_39_12]KKR19646.1 MAG: hypothetical protein UT49_C0001G0122 [Parcubacteria group bacterium GW2011_GWF1_39_37]KKR35802.1 MAG: hypothetical protein UT68_C0001G0125 [Parcubacteria group bacterium GW2011_GWC2_40_10]KKR52614.1 MAG: hypothetical protein UT89_C0001G0122 [Parcubacteria group bacterium GW2011_GWE1_40_20]KKR66066.1 MAG: hypothetical protein UU06_C0006G0017 [Parcubacteria group bacterium GW2011_GWB1_40_